jgi:ABC-type Mn2+/Zn2+ transport system ATPase subunit
VSLSVRPEERLVIIGQNGAGKTTILRLLLGILTPTRGSTFFRQRE